MPVRLGISPIGWSNDDLRELGGDTALETCLAEARLAGFQGIELGNKFPRDPAVLRPILERHGLSLSSGWYRLADFRVLVIDKHPLCPTAESITTALNRLVDRLAKLEVRVVRENPRLPDLAQTGRIYRELLAAFFIADLPPETLERAATAVKDLPADDQSLAAAQLRGLTISHADWIRKSRIRSGLRARWVALFEDVDVVLCPPMPTVAFPHDHSPQFARQLDIDGVKVPYNDQSVWAGIALPERAAGDDDAR